MVMADLPDKSQLQHNMNEIYRASERARDLVKQILTFSRQKEQARTITQVSLVMKEALKLLRSSIPTSIEIKQYIKTESDTIFVDPTQIHQIMMNLFTNAAYAMRENGGVLELSLTDENIGPDKISEYHNLSSGSYVKLAVSDTGHGIKPDVLDRIFEPYYTTKEPDKGTGLGLAVVHGIVKSYGGDITVQSDLGKGTTFQVLLPKTETEISSVTGRKPAIPKGTEKLLFVDDEKVMVDVIQSMLDRFGYKVTARTSSIEALEVFRSKPDEFDLVITDMTMPHMTGVELSKEIMKIRPDIPIILCTGFSEQINENKAKELGLAAYVMKPITMQEIVQTIRKVLDKKEYSVQNNYLIH